MEILLDVYKVKPPLLVKALLFKNFVVFKRIFSECYMKNPPISRSEVLFRKIESFNMI